MKESFVCQSQSLLDLTNRLSSEFAFPSGLRRLYEICLLLGKLAVIVNTALTAEVVSPMRIHKRIKWGKNRRYNFTIFETLGEDNVNGWATYQHTNINLRFNT